MDSDLYNTFGIISDPDIVEDEDESLQITHGKEILDRIVELVDAFVHEGSLDYALHSLEALCHTKYCFSMPNVEILIRLRTAELYIQNSNHCFKALEHLQLAYRSLVLHKHPFCNEQIKLCWSLCELNTQLKQGDWLKENIKYCKKGIDLSSNNHVKCAFMLNLIRFIDLKTEGLKWVSFIEQGLNLASDKSYFIVSFRLVLSQIYLLSGHLAKVYENLTLVNDILATVLEQCYNAKSLAPDINFVLTMEMNVKETLQGFDVFLMKLHHLALTMFYMIELGEYNEAKKAFDQFHDIYVSNRIQQQYKNVQVTYYWVDVQIIDILYHYFGAVCFSQDYGLVTHQHIREGLSKCKDYIDTYGNANINVNTVLYIQLNLLEISFYWDLAKSLPLDALHILTHAKHMATNLMIEGSSFIEEMESSFACWLSNIPEMETHIQNALQISQPTQKKCSLSLCYALFLVREKSFRKASEVLKDYLDDAYASSNVMIKILVLYIESLVDMERNLLEESKTKLKHILKLNNTKVCNQRINGLCFMALSKILIKTKDFNELPNILTTLWNIAQPLEDTVLQITLLKALMEAYKELEDHIMYNQMLSHYHAAQKMYQQKRVYTEGNKNEASLETELDLEKFPHTITFKRSP